MRGSALLASIASSTQGRLRAVAGHAFAAERGDAPRRRRPGDAIILRTGLSGTWEEVETTRKGFVIRL